jgi:integrase
VDTASARGGSPLRGASGSLRRGTFNKLVGWRAAAASIGVPDFHFHDLRHTGDLLAAECMVSTRDLMVRMGHDSMAAALIYQHAARQADRRIADHLGSRMAELKISGDRRQVERDAAGSAEPAE